MLFLWEKQSPKWARAGACVVHTHVPGLPSSHILSGVKILRYVYAAKVVVCMQGKRIGVYYDFAVRSVNYSQFVVDLFDQAIADMEAAGMPVLLILRSGLWILCCI